jgi:toluene-4-monooxygenase system protein B
MTTQTTNNSEEVVPVEGADFLPLGFRFDDDFLVHFMTVDRDATIGDICSAAAGYVAGYRVPPRDGQLQLTFAGEVQPSDRRARDAGIGWLDYVEVNVVP